MADEYRLPTRDIIPPNVQGVREVGISSSSSSSSDLPNIREPENLPEVPKLPKTSEVIEAVENVARSACPNCPSISCSGGCSVTCFRWICDCLQQFVCILLRFFS